MFLAETCRMDERYVVQARYLDISKALGSVSHSPLDRKLQAFCTLRSAGQCPVQLLSNLALQLEWVTKYPDLEMSALEYHKPLCLNPSVPFIYK